MAIRKMFVYLFCVLLLNCKLQKAKLRGSDGASNAVAPIPKWLSGSFVVKLVGKGPTSTGASSAQKATLAKTSVVASGPALYPLHFSFLMAFSEDGREMRFSSCLDSDADAAKIEGAKISSDENLPLQEVLRFLENKQSRDSSGSRAATSSNGSSGALRGNEDSSSKPVGSESEKAGSTASGFSREPVKCAKDLYAAGSLLLADTTYLSNDSEDVDLSLESRARNDQNPTADSVPTTAEMVKGEAQIPGNVLKYGSKSNIELNLRANSEGWQIDAMTYFGREAWIEHVVTR